MTIYIYGSIDSGGRVVGGGVLHYSMVFMWW